MVQETEKKVGVTSAQEMENWFDELIAQISTDKLMLETNTANPSKIHFYDTMINGSEQDIFKLTRSATTMHFLRALLIDYLQVLNEIDCQPIHLAFDLSDSNILVWAEIKDEDTETENNLILTEAQINAKYAQFGFYISSTIVEKSDLAITPPHYKKVK